MGLLVRDIFCTGYRQTYQVKNIKTSSYLGNVGV